MCKQVEFVEDNLRNLRVVGKDAFASLVRLVAFWFSFGGDGEADFGEGGRDVGRRVGEGDAGVADGDVDDRG